MNSFNHWAFGSVAEWVWRMLVGLNPDPAYPGWRHFVVWPRPCEGLDWVEATYHSVRGPIRVHWRLDEDLFELKLQVPANCRATVVLPGSGPVTEGGRDVTDDSVEGVTLVSTHSDRVVLQVSSGRFVFRTRWGRQTSRETDE